MYSIDELLEEIQSYLQTEQKDMIQMFNENPEDQIYFGARFDAYYDASENIRDIINRYRKSTSEHF